MSSFACPSKRSRETGGRGRRLIYIRWGSAASTTIGALATSDGRTDLVGHGQSPGVGRLAKRAISP